MKRENFQGSRLTLVLSALLVVLVSPYSLCAEVLNIRVSKRSADNVFVAYGTSTNAEKV